MRSAGLASMVVLAACSYNWPQAAPADASIDADAGAAAHPAITCRPPKRGALPIALEPVFPHLSFQTPVDVLTAPGDVEHLYVVEAIGTVRRVADDPQAGSAPVFLDVRARLQRYTGEVGLWDIAFHPQYPDVPYLYAFLSTDGGTTDFRSLLLRFSTPDGGLTIDHESETVLLAIERAWGAVHGGGKLGFDADGMLLVSTGDGDIYGDPAGKAQDPSSLLGKMLRLDVDHGEPYGIPLDNPFAFGGGAAPEVYALGFRNPWRWSIDRATGTLWLGDVGHERTEEIDRVVPGGNYGWNTREGTLCWAVQPCTGNFIDPVYEYGRTDGSSVIGGYVYRGDELDDLAGRYVFGDYTSGRIWALGTAGAELLLESGLAIVAFAEDRDRELLVMDNASGSIFRLVDAVSAPVGVPAPFLRATGCLDDPRLEPYSVNAPLWSDGLDKHRSIVVPDGEHARVEDDGRWELPAGTVAVKTFSHAGVPIETRLLVRDASGAWSGWTYRWTPGGDATRVDDGAVLDLDGQAWTIPSNAECARCHTPAADFVLGLTQPQLERGDQLDRLTAHGIVENVRVDVAPLVGIDSPAPLARRARSYLHANCSMCHRPGGPAPGELDLRAGVSLAETNSCDRAPAFGTLGGPPDAKVIAPGDPARSILLTRLATRGSGQMPPLGSHVVDTAARDVIADWITSLQGCHD